ncbi:lipoate--protein ligase [Mesonia sp.]|uniref:lipoate--protein ligase n=1 Tax=Mesonia sp. TaxID=1960830 RepID=UPI003F996008
MVFIENEGINDPHLNLALEEYILRNFDRGEDYLLFYINEPSIIIGRNQNTLEEINQSYTEENGVHIVRRISGGGAVYHDLGNLNFSFITDYDNTKLNNFRNFTSPVVKALNGMGVKAELKGRNDILVGDKKISGNAQFSSVKRMFSHGTLLFDCDLNEVQKTLNVKMSKIQSKGHKSVRSRVANITEFLPEPMEIQSFRKKIIEEVYREQENFKTYHLTEEEWDGVKKLKAEKYDQWDWNYGKSPKFNIHRTKRFAVGEIDIRIFVEKGTIKSIKIYGDFFGKEPVENIEEVLTGKRYDLAEITTALAPIAVKDYFGNVDQQEFIDLLYGEDEV